MTEHLCEHLYRVFIVELGCSDSIPDPYTLYAKITTSALLLSYNIRRGTAVCIRLPQGWLLAHGLRVRRLYADESSSRGLVRAAIRRGSRSGLRVEPTCVFTTCCRAEISLDELLSGSISKDIATPLCIRVSAESNEVSIDGYRIAVWHAIAIANIVLDRFGVST